MIKKIISIIIQEGEGQRVEFKENLSHLDREIVGFANAGGGSVFIGISDSGAIVGTDVSNRRLSEISDLARNCDPPVDVQLIKYPNGVLEVAVEEGDNKPYRCKDGFFVRIGPSCQKLKRDEIAAFILNSGSFHYDEMLNKYFKYPDDFDADKFNKFIMLCGLAPQKDPLVTLNNMDCARNKDREIRFTNAAILFFAKAPQNFLKESGITCVCYSGEDRISIADRVDLTGDSISLFNEALSFILRHINREQKISNVSNRHEDVFDYPVVALREALINSIMHRDYYNDSSCIYVHLFANRLEIENPGGLPGGLTLSELGDRSVRRNRTIADLLYRAGFAEKIGSGIQRMRNAMVENNNPPPEISVTNYFVVRFFKRVRTGTDIVLSPRQILLIRSIKDRGSLTVSDAAGIINASNDTVLREMHSLMNIGIVKKEGIGKKTRYFPQS